MLQQALGLDTADYALLRKDEVYQVRVTWDGARERRPEGQPPTDKAPFPGRQQSFWFKTDADPPRRLDPWVLVALPGQGEAHYFASEPVRVVFATNNVNLIYGAYGKKLQARLKPSSFRPVASTAATPHPFPLTPANLKPVKAAVLSPWEGAMQAQLTGSCVPTDNERVRHSMITMPIPLDLDTDYLIDIEMLDAAAADGSPGERVVRSFSTGNFRTLDEFAAAFQATRVGHRGVHPDDQGKLQAVGATFAARDPEGSEFDTALIQAGLDPQPVANVPRVTIFWDPVAPRPPAGGAAG